jgi:hypothetical protein
MLEGGRGGLAKTLGGEQELPEAVPAEGPVEVLVELGTEQEEDLGGTEPIPLEKSVASRASVGVSVATVPPTVDVDAGLEELRKATTAVAAGAAPSQALGTGVYGLTFPESVQVTIGAKKTGTKWNPVVKNLLGRYSLQARLLPGQSEITGPTGNTTNTNFCAQATNLQSLGNTVGNPWYMLSAVVAHENVHATRFKPALDAAEPAITSAIEAVSVPDTPGMDEAAAVAALQAAPAFVAAVQAARQTWLAQILTLVAGDHAAGGPTDTAERGVVGPMLTTICNHAKAQSWGPCPACP